MITKDTFKPGDKFLTKYDFAGKAPYIYTHWDETLPFSVRCTTPEGEDTGFRPGTTLVLIEAAPKFKKGDIITNDHYAGLGQNYEFVSQVGECTHVLRLPDRTTDSFTGDCGLYLVSEPTPKFKVGDVLTREGWEDITVLDVPEGGYTILFGDGSGAGWRDFDYVEDYWELKVEEPTEGNNAISPSVYQFPNAEVRDISAHLTSFGGQALQYVARSTRLDGLFKEDKVQDLEKAKLMIQWEIDRLEAGS